MNYWKHSLLSKKKFNGEPEDYLEVHKFLDSSKLYYFNIKHRALLHHTYGIDLCTQRFGEILTNSENQKVLIRDIAAEHCKEDLMGIVPTLNNWFKHADPEILHFTKPLNPADGRLREFVLRPLLMSGLRSTLIITHSNFGINLVKDFLGIEYALEWATYLQEVSVNDLLQYLKLRDKWQYTPDLKQLKGIENECVQ